MKLEDIAFRDDWYDSYTRYKDPKLLADAIRKGDPDINLPRMREFIADVIEGKIQLPTKGNTDKEKEERNIQIINEIFVFKGARLPIRDIITNIDCCTMVGEGYGLKGDSIYKTIWKKREELKKHNYFKIIDENASCFVFGMKQSLAKGRMVYQYNNNTKPQTREEFLELLDTIYEQPERKALYEIAVNEIQEEYITKLRNKFIEKIKECAKINKVLLSENELIIFIENLKDYAKQEGLDEDQVYNGAIKINSETIKYIKQQDKK